MFFLLNFEFELLIELGMCFWLIFLFMVLLFKFFDCLWFLCFFCCWFLCWISVFSWFVKFVNLLNVVWLCLSDSIFCLRCRFFWSMVVFFLSVFILCWNLCFFFWKSVFRVIFLVRSLLYLYVYFLVLFEFLNDFFLCEGFWSCSFFFSFVICFINVVICFL